jgi:hypothetical protein
MKLSVDATQKELKVYTTPCHTLVFLATDATQKELSARRMLYAVPASL